MEITAGIDSGCRQLAARTQGVTQGGLRKVYRQNMNGEDLRKQLHAGNCVYGTHVTHTSNPIAASVLASAGLDFVFLCSEHMPLDRTEMSALCCLYASKGISPAVRISRPDSAEACRALDAGAQGIVVPYVETVEEVRNMVGAVRYRPIKGQLLRDFLTGSRKPSAKTNAFLQRFNGQHWLIIGIESVAAYKNLDSLISVPGVDGVFIGPHDLSVSLEAPEDWNHPEFHRMIEDIVIRCRAANIGVGAHLTPGIFTNDRVRHLISVGMNWILDASDLGHAVHALRERHAAFGIGSAKSDASSTSVSPQSCAVVESKSSARAKSR
jgi:2-keto-3-deoxy-L-rhamnonate aldolase RhmA